MRLARALTTDGIVAGTYEGDTITADGTSYAIGEDAELRVPCDPSVIYCIGLNYGGYIEASGREPPEEPEYFIKPPVSICHPEGEIPYPNFSNDLTYGGELAAVIDEECKNLARSEVPDVVRGYTILNDVTAPDQPTITAKKAFDGSAPIGPWIETELEPYSLDMRTTINGEIRQDASTDDMLFDPDELIAFLSERFTLRPGDVIALGSPANPGSIEPGDEIEIRYEGIGTLRNTVGPTVE